MKRNTLLLMLLCLSLASFAQEVAIEQTIDQPINNLSIGKGWDVRLTHRDTDSYRLAIVVPEAFAEIASEVQACTLSDGKLTILENITLPQSTIIELEGPLDFQSIGLTTEARVEIDRFIVSEKNAKCGLYLSKSSKATIHHLVSNGDPYITLEERSKLSIDTITGRGNPSMEIYNNKFEQCNTKFIYGVNLLDGEILIYEFKNEFKSPMWPYKEKDVKVIKTKMKDGQPVTTEHYKIWNPNNPNITTNIGVSYRRRQTPVDFNSPFTNNGIYTLNVGASANLCLGAHWTLSTGLRYNTNTYYMAHQLKLSETGLENIDGQTPIQQNRLDNGYLGIPVELFFNFPDPINSSFSFDVFFARRLYGRLQTRNAEDNYKKWHNEKATQLFNPWKLEVGVSFNTGLIGFVHGIRVYTNLLPEYNKSVTTEKFRSIGVEFKL